VKRYSDPWSGSGKVIRILFIRVLIHDP